MLQLRRGTEQGRMRKVLVSLVFRYLHQLRVCARDADLIWILVRCKNASGREILRKIGRGHESEEGVPPRGVARQDDSDEDQSRR